MILPTMRVASTGATVGLDVRPVANSGESVDEQDGFMDLNPTFDKLAVSDFAIRVARSDITEDVDDSEAVIQDPDEYIRNLASLDGAAFDSSTVLAGSSSAFDWPDHRNRQALFSPKKYNSPALVKPEHKVRKHVASDYIVSLLLISPGEIGVTCRGGKIGSTNFQACVAPVLPGQATCGVGFHVTKAKRSHKNNVYIRAATVRHNLTAYLSPALLVSSVSSDMITALLHIKRVVSYRLFLLLSTLDGVVAIRSNHLTPHKNQSLPSSMMDIQSLSFVASSLVQADDELAISASDPDSLLPILCSRVDTLYISSEKLRKGFVAEDLVLSGQVHSLGIEVELLGDNSVLLRSA